jgi:hypothetical protein
MPGRIGLTIDTNDLTLAVGERALVSCVVTNQGDVVDAFTLAIPALSPDWYTLTPAQVSLFPQTQALVMLEIHPPATGTTLAGDYPFQLVVASRDQPDERMELTITLHIAAVSELAVALEPQRIVARQGTFQVRLTNNGNVDRPVVVRPSDPDARLVFTFGAAEALPAGATTTPLSTGADPAAPADPNVSVAQPVGTLAPLGTEVLTEWTPPVAGVDQGRLELTVPPATTVQIPVTVAPRRRIWVGPVTPLTFEIMVTPPGVEWEEREAQKVNGELSYSPYLLPWAMLPLALRRVMLLAVPLLMLGLILFLLLRPAAAAPAVPTPVLPDINATLTAVAVSASQTAAAAAATQTANAAASQTAAAAATQTALALAAQQTAEAAATQTALAAAQQTAAANAALTAQAAAALTPVGLPTILKLTIESAPGTQQGARVTWVVSNAEKVTLNNDPVALTGSRPVVTSTDQALTLVATNANGSVSQSTGLLLVRPPQIVSYTADQTTVPAGTEVTLSWRTLGAAKLTLNGQPVSGPDGTQKVRPTVTTDYLLTAENALGPAVSVVTVNVTGTATPGAQNASP